MTDAAPRHPDVHVLAAFIDGKLAPQEIRPVADHLRECAECRTIVYETSRFEREENPVRKAGAPRSWWLAAAAVAVLAIVTAPKFRSPVGKLIAAAPRDHRTLESRLSGFHWARLQAPARGTTVTDPGELKLMGVAGDILEQTANATDARSLHQRGLALLLTGRPGECIAALERGAMESKDARVWSDLAAARYAFAETHAAQLPEALADTNRAIELDPRCTEAHFNRALILERLGLREAARKEWQRYLDLDPGGEWSAEAREHLRQLGSDPIGFDPKLLETMPPAELVRTFTQEARTRGEGPVLEQWGQGNVESRLTLARSLGAALAAFNGERLLADAVAAIDGAGVSERGALAEAHTLYAKARRSYSKRDLALAESGFRNAEELFRRGRSPMSYLAAYYAASAAFDQNRGDEARAALLSLATQIEGRSYLALTAQLRSELAVVENSAGEWGTAARDADTSAALFRRLGELNNAAYVDGTAAHALEMLGERDAAWARRMRCYGRLSAKKDRGQLSTMVHSAAMTLFPLDHTAAAEAFLDLLIDEARDDDAKLAFTLADGARYAARRGETERVNALLTEARQRVHKVADASLQATVNAEITLADATMRRVTDPRGAIALLDATLPTFGNGQLHFLLPDLYLQRARSYQAAGDATSASRDYTAALSEIERPRDGAGAEPRPAFLDSAAQIMDEAIDFHVTRGEIGEAFDVAERAHTLFEPAYAATTARATAASVAPDTLLIEYAVLPKGIVIFSVFHGNVTAARVNVDRRALTARIDSLEDKIRRRAPLAEIEDDAGALHDLLIAPVRAQVASAREIALVPDRPLYGVPFGALWDRSAKQYVIEQKSLHLVGSAAAAADHRDSDVLTPALVVKDPSTDLQPRLAAGSREAERIASTYGATLLAGDAATRARFVALAAESSLIHYTGHANSETDQPYGALLLARDGTDSGVVSSGEIAHLSLRARPLVVLAACGTLRGDRSHIGGMSSLARAFLTAGARGAVGTLWEIEDDLSASLFLSFHEQLRKGATPARALQMAQLAMLHSSDAHLRHPATWAPVELLSGR